MRWYAPAPHGGDQGHGRQITAEAVQAAITDDRRDRRLHDPHVHGA